MKEERGRRRMVMAMRSHLVLVWLLGLLSLCHGGGGPAEMGAAAALRRRLAAVKVPSFSKVSATTSSSRMYNVMDYGADPTGIADSTEAITKAVADAFGTPSNRTLTAGIPDLGGAEVYLGGGTYLVSSPITIPATGGGNFKIHGGSLRASNTFPTDRYVIELWASSATNSYVYEYATLSGLMVDSNFRGGGIAVVDSLRTTIDDCLIVGFMSDGIIVRGGHETFIRNSFLGQHMTAGTDPGEKNFSGIGINLSGNDNVITDVVIFSAAIGILVSGQANILTGVHCYNKATGWGGTGIYLKLPGLTQTRIVNSYLDYTGIVSEDPVQLHVSGTFFLGDANIVLKSVKGVINGLDVVDNMFSGSDKGVDIIRLDESSMKFKDVDQVFVDRNVVDGMRLRSTTAKASMKGNATIWTVDFSPVLLFPNRIEHVQYTLQADSAFPNHALRNTSANKVVIESDVPVKATIHVAVDQNMS